MPVVGLRWQADFSDITTYPPSYPYIYLKFIFVDMSRKEIINESHIRYL